MFKNLINFYRISVKALIYDSKKQKILLAKEANGKWDFLGGGLDFNESVEDCLKRELEEESGLKVTWVNFQPSYFLTAKKFGKVWYANVFYKVKVKDLNFIPTRECQEIRFFNKAELLKQDVFENVEIFCQSEIINNLIQ